MPLNVVPRFFSLPGRLAMLLALFAALAAQPAPIFADEPEAPAPAEAPAEGATEADAEDEAPADEPAGDPAGDPEPASDDAEAEAEGADGPDAVETVNLAFQNQPLPMVARFLNEQLGKPVVIHASVQNKRITVINTREMPLPEAIQVLRGALLLEEVIIDEGPQIITLRPLDTAQFANLPLLSEDDDPADFEDASQIVRKVFRLTHYDPQRMQQAVSAMVPSYGSVSVEPGTSKLIVIDTIGNLQRIAQVIANLDVPAAQQTITRIFEIQHHDAAWIVSIIRTMLGEAGAAPAPQPRPMMGRPAPRPAGPGSVVSIASNDGPVVLYAETTRNWIIAVASSATIDSIAGWVDQLDQPEQVAPEAFDIHTVQYVNLSQIANQLQQAVDSMPPDVRESVRIVPMPQSQQVVVFGSRRGRQTVASLLERLDVEDAGNQVREVFELRHADAATVADQIETLFDTTFVTFRSQFGSTSYGRDPSATRVRVTYDSRRNTVTVIADARTMEEIRTMVREQWDKPLSADDVRPRVYTLQYADPVQMQEVLEALFSRRQRTPMSPWSFYFGGSQTETTPVGRLFGQFSFQTMPGSNRLVVTTQNVENYTVIDSIIAELDVPQEAGLPRLIELNHAYAEDLAEQLNALLAEPGTLAEILRSRRGLSGPTGSMSAAGIGDRERQQQQQRGEGDERDPGTLAFWWQRDRQRDNEAPTSNLIGKIRIVPVKRRNALLVLAPRAHVDPVATLIADLDRPGMQVVIHAVIAEIRHDDTSSLGVRFASDRSLFDDPRLFDQSIGGSAAVDYTDVFGGTFTVGQDTASRGILDVGLNVHALIQLLMRRFDMRILLEPQLYTADNQEAEFFDGQDVSVQTDSRITDTGVVIRSFVYHPVGTRLRVRPHITQNGDVDLLVNLEVSRIVTGETIFGNPIFDRRETTTHVVVHSGQTVMLSGIIRQEDIADVRKLPLLGDLPLIGGLFRSTERGQRNHELVAFITPHVITADPEDAERVMRHHRERMESFRGDFRMPREFDVPEEEEPYPDDDDAPLPPLRLPPGERPNEG